MESTEPQKDRGNLTSGMRHSHTATANGERMRQNLDEKKGVVKTSTVSQGKGKHSKFKRKGNGKGKKREEGGRNLNQ